MLILYRCIAERHHDFQYSTRSPGAPNISLSFIEVARGNHVTSPRLPFPDNLLADFVLYHRSSRTVPGNFAFPFVVK